MPDIEPEIFRDVREAHRKILTDSRFGLDYSRRYIVSSNFDQPYASLDHFIGRTVIGANPDDGKWSIMLEGGVVVSNKDAARGFPDVDLVGKTLLFVAFSEMETRLRFGHSSRADEMSDPTVVSEAWVILSPTQYTLSGLEGQTEEFYPQMPEELVDVLPPDPSGDRIADGPIEEALEPAESVEEGQ